MTERVVMARRKAIIGSTRTCLVKKAITVSVRVRAMVPVSESINRAGGILNHKKAKRLPAMTKENAAKSIWFWKKAMAP